MNPLWYKSSAMLIAFDAENPKTVAAAKNLVLKGSRLPLIIFRFYISYCAKISLLLHNRFCLIFLPKRPFLCVAINRSPFLSNSANISQDIWVLKAKRSFSLPTINAKVGLWTLPAEINSEPSLFETIDKYRVRTALQTRSISLLASAESANA